MDANKFIAEHKRMCASYINCMHCPMYPHHVKCEEIVSNYTDEFITKWSKTVENWSAAHPVTTRAALFKKKHPFVLSDSSGALLICPVVVDKNVICPLNGECKQCRKNYWLKEVQNGR
jgi:hypothetical protein